MIKRIFSAIIVFVICVSMASVNVFASGQGCWIFYGDITNFINNNGSAEMVFEDFFDGEQNFVFGTPSGDQTLTLGENTTYKGAYYFT